MDIATESDTVSNRLNRSAGGRFAAGNAGGPGSRNNARMAALRNAISKCCRPSQLVELFQSMRMQALNGDVAAARVLLSYVVGRPREAQQLTASTIALPMANGRELCQGIDGIAQAYQAGELDNDQARFLLSLVEAKRQTLAHVEIENRIAALEAAS